MAVFRLMEMALRRAALNLAQAAVAAVRPTAGVILRQVNLGLMA